MGQLLLTTDSESEIVLQESRSVAMALTVAGLGGALVLRRLLPELLIAQGLLALFTLWMLRQVLTLHRLRFDLEHRTISYHRGWRFADAVRQDSLDSVKGVYIDRYEPTLDAAASRLRSRLISVELRDWDDPFVFGFPMGPKVAADQAADYARRLGVAVVDRVREDSGDEPPGNKEQKI